MPLYSRKDMPQVNTQDLSKALSIAKSKVKVTKGMSIVGSLKPSQKELISNKVKAVSKKYNKPTDMKPLIISKDNYIVDGHHRWAAAIYKFGKDTIVPTFRLHLKRDEAIELYNDIASSLNEVMGKAARMKLARKSKSRLKKGLKKRIRKMKKKRSNSDLLKAAERKAKTILMQKMMKKSPADMSMNDKIKFSKKLAKNPGKIQKVARKILPKIKQAEAERVKTMKANNTKKTNEVITIPINVGDTVLGGKFKNKRIVVKSIGKNEKGDITINNKPLMKFRLMNESTGASIQCSNCTHSWDIIHSDDRPYLCHNCGYDAQSQKIDLVGLEDWKKTLKENVAPNHNGKSAPYGSGYDVVEDIIVEGMYDKLTGQINKDVFKTIKNAIKGSGTQVKPNKFKGYMVRKDPMGTMQDLFAKETRKLKVGDYSDNISGVDVEVVLKLAVTEDGVEPGKFFIDGFADADEDWPSLEVNIGIHPDDINGSIFSKIQPVLRDLVRHEIEHLTHGKGSASEKPSKTMRGDDAMRRKIQDNPKLYYKYFLLPKEVDANIHGLYSKAKTIKKPYQKVVDDYLDSLVDDGVITTKKRTEIYTTWKKRIPKIGGIPKLK